MAAKEGTRGRVPSVMQFRVVLQEEKVSRLQEKGAVHSTPMFIRERQLAGTGVEVAETSAHAIGVTLQHLILAKK